VKRFVSGLRLLALGSLLGLACWATLPPAASREEKDKDKPKFERFNQRTKADLAKRIKRRFVPLHVVGSRRGKVVEVTLTVSIKIHEIDSDVAGKQSDRIRTRSYNCSLCGPVIRVRPGDQLRVHLKNEIKRTEPDEEPQPNSTAPHGFNVTNLHTHGLNVSPSGRSDNVFLDVGPEESIHLCFDIPEDHPCGTFWYHAHKHGSVALQLAGGMAGVLIVDGEGDKRSLDEQPAIKEATKPEHEKILVFQQIPYTPDDSGKVVDVKWQDVYAPPADKIERAAKGKLKRYTLVNGEMVPTISMRPGEVQRWRCVHGGLEESLALALVKADTKLEDVNDKKKRVPLYEIAVDGLPLGRLETWHAKPVELQPGYRSDLLVSAPEPGHYLLVSQPIDDGTQSVTGHPQGLINLARVEVTGAAMNPPMKLPSDDDLKDYPEKQGLKPIPKVDASRDVEFRSVDETKTYVVNKQPFDKDRILFCPKLGDAEEWTLRPAAGFHPFHVHVNPFVIDRITEDGKPHPTWRDTLFISEDIGKVKVRTRFNKFTGKTVLHCHNLRHEDQGMMAAFRITGTDTVQPKCQPPASGLSVDTEAPAWELLDPQGDPIKSAKYKDKKLLLVFSRGSGCVHCREQVQALIAKKDELAKAGLTVLVVAPVAPSKLPQKDFPFVALSDEWWVAFKDYRCFDGRALHGTYLINSKGTIRFADAGDEPFMEVDELLKKAAMLE